MTRQDFKNKISEQKEAIAKKTNERCRHFKIGKWLSLGLSILPFGLAIAGGLLKRYDVTAIGLTLTATCLSFSYAFHSKASELKEKSADDIGAIEKIEKEFEKLEK